MNRRTVEEKQEIAEALLRGLTVKHLSRMHIYDDVITFQYFSEIYTLDLSGITIRVRDAGQDHPTPTTTLIEYIVKSELNK